MLSCLERARDGDPRAIKDLVDIMRPRITSMASYYARCCGEDPEDLLQEAWIGFLEALPEVRMEIGSPEQYLIQRARWRMLDDIKRLRVRRCAPLDQEIAAEIPAVPGPDGSDRVFMGQFLGRLKDSQKMVLGCLLGGLTWREVGRAMGCSSANVAYHVRQIRQRYEEWEDEQLELAAGRHPGVSREAPAYPPRPKGMRSSRKRRKTLAGDGALV